MESYGDIVRGMTDQEKIELCRALDGTVLYSAFIRRAQPLSEMPAEVREVVQQILDQRKGPDDL